MATKCCTKLEVEEKRCPIVFEGLPSNFKVTRLKKSSILTQIRHFRTVTPVWIHQWLRNEAKSLKLHRRGALLFFGVIHQISRSHGSKSRQFESNLSKIIRPVAAIKSLRFALFSNDLSTFGGDCHIWPFCVENDVNSLGPSDAIWQRRSRSTLAQVMACCLTAPSHYLNQYWLIIGEVPCHSSRGIIIRRCEDTNQ